MTPDQFRAALEYLDIPQVRFGPDHLGKSERTVRRYASGKRNVPTLVAEKVTELVEAKKAAEASA